MTNMHYRGYIGSAEVSVEDGVVFGKLLFIRDLVSYEADTPNKLSGAFECAVDDYISECAQDGKEPDRPFKGQFNVRVSPNLHRSLALDAQSANMSLNEYVETILISHENSIRLSNVTDQRKVRSTKGYVANLSSPALFSRKKMGNSHPFQPSSTAHQLQKPVKRTV